MALIPGGEFQMGDHHDGMVISLPVHAVYIDAFHMDVYEVTLQQYAHALNWAWSQGGLISVANGVVYHTDGDPIYCDTTTNTSRSRITWNGSTFGVVGEQLPPNDPGNKTNHPMIRVSWFGAAAYANWRAGMEDRTPSYNTSTWECNFEAAGYRLPTEAEWEKAARGGMYTPYWRYPWGDTFDGSKANYWGSGDPYESDEYPRTTPVGYYDGNQVPVGSDMANGFGLYDMDGNVFEWCNDWWDEEYYEVSPYDNPRGSEDNTESESGPERVTRSGAWSHDEYGLRCARRQTTSPSQLIGAVGFRCVLGTLSAALHMETVTVGNLGNAGQWSGQGHEPVLGFGPDRICGAVNYVYEIGKFEVTAEQYAEFLNAVARDDTYGLYNPRMNSDPEGCQITQHGGSGNYTYDFSGRPSGTEADWLDRPANYLSWADAARFCNWMHNGQPTGTQDLSTTEDGSYLLDGAISDAQSIAVVREPDATWVIPSEDEWYKAAYHKNDGATGNYWLAPTSTFWTSGYVNSAGNLSGTGEPFIDGGIDPGNYATYDGNSGNIGIGPPYHRTKVGEWENSASPYGTLDQGGNVFEWNEAVLYGSCRGLRGGSIGWGNGFLYAPMRLCGDPNIDERYDYRLGFRVAEVPRFKSDIDFDGDVDLNDYELLRDVDLHNYALLQAAFTGGQ